MDENGKGISVPSWRGEILSQYVFMCALEDGLWASAEIKVQRLVTWSKAVYIALPTLDSALPGCVRLFVQTHTSDILLVTALN